MQVILLCTAQKRLALSLPVYTGLVYLVQRLYLRTSRQLRFLDLESRAAVLSTFLESVSRTSTTPNQDAVGIANSCSVEQVEGLETIRAFGWLGESVTQAITRLENSLRLEFLLRCLQQWLTLVLDMIAATVATGIIAAAVALHGQISGGQVGVALNLMLVANTTLVRLIESWTNLEVSLGAIARLQMLDKTTPSEMNENTAFEPPSGWPTQGRIEFKGITAAYQ